MSQPSLGIGRATSLVTGNIIGAGIFMLPASLAAYGNIGLLGLLVTTGGALCLAFVFARLAHDLPIIGGPYAYSRRAFGDFIGFQMAWMYWVGTWASVAAITIAFVNHLSVFWPTLHDNIALTFIISLSTVWLFTFINLISIRFASTVQLITTILKILPLAAIILFGLPKIHWDYIFTYNYDGHSFWWALSSSSALTLFSFIGLESATIPAEDVKDPQRTIPIATILGTLLAALIYLGTMLVVFGLLSPEQMATSTTPFVDAGSHIFGASADPIVTTSIILCCLGTLTGWILIQGQMPVAMARDGLFPAFFDQHNKTGSPYLALIVSSVLVSLLLFLNYEAGLVEQFNTIVFFTTFTVILTYLYSATAELYLLATQPSQMSRPKLIRAVIITLISFAYMMFIAFGAGQKAAFLGMLFVFSGFPFYVLMKRDHFRKKTADSVEQQEDK